MRRNRMQSFSRRLMAESSLSVDDLIWPLFVVEGHGVDTCRGLEHFFVTFLEDLGAFEESVGDGTFARPSLANDG